MKRNLILSPAFKDFAINANPRTRDKLRYAISMWNTYERVFVAEYQQYKKIKVQKFAYV